MKPDIDWLTARPIAHRGLHDLNNTCWENTLTAFKHAAERNYSIECDVQLSRDGVAIVFHDYVLKRLTGIDGNASELTAADLADLQIGGTGDQIPTLADMLNLVGGRVPIVIELKGNFGHDAGLLAAVASALKGYSGPVAVMSFAHWLVRGFHDEMPDIPAGLVVEGTKPRELEAHFSMLAHDPDFISVDVEDLPNPFITVVREKLGLPVITWTVKDARTVALTRAHADQMTFEGFDPDTGPA